MKTILEVSTIKLLRIYNMLARSGVMHAESQALIVKASDRMSVDDCLGENSSSLSLCVKYLKRL